MRTYDEVYMTPQEAELIDGTNIRYIFGKFAGEMRHRALVFLL